MTMGDGTGANDEALKIARIEEKVDHMSQDVKDIKTNFGILLDKLATLHDKIANLHKEYMTRTEAEDKMDNLEERLEATEKELKKIKEETIPSLRLALQKRPSWGVALTITALVGLCIGLGTFIVTGHVLTAGG